MVAGRSNRRVSENAKTGKEGYERSILRCRDERCSREFDERGDSGYLLRSKIPKRIISKSFKKEKARVRTMPCPSYCG